MACAHASAEQFIPDIEEIDECQISLSLEDFAFGKDSFSRDDNAFFREGTQALPDDDDDDNDDAQDGFGDVPDFGTAMDVDGATGSAAPVEDFFVGDQAVPDDFADFGPDYNPDDDAGSQHGSEGVSAEARQAGQGGGQFVPFDPRRAPGTRDIIMAIDDTEGGVQLNYFDASHFKNWAGPEHWKLRKVVRRREYVC